MNNTGSDDTFFVGGAWLACKRRLRRSLVLALLVKKWHLVHIIALSNFCQHSALGEGGRWLLVVVSVSLMCVRVAVGGWGAQTKRH